MLMKAIIEEAEPEVAAHMQNLALAEGALVRHLHTAMFTESTDNRMLTNRFVCYPFVATSVCVSTYLSLSV